VIGKDLVLRLVDAINQRDWSQLDELCTPELAPKLRTAFVQFEEAFPDWKQEIVELVEEPPLHGYPDWRLDGPAGERGRMQVDEVSFVRFTALRISGMWGLEDTWTRMRQLAGDDATLGERGSLS
jgi:hypothetical protein